jgi:hypothetical protein
MGLFPEISDDLFDLAGQLTGDNPNATSDQSFATTPVPATSSLGTRSGQIPNGRAGIFTRKLMQWMIPEGPIVQMYINPQSVRTNYSKTITPQRTKGGFVVQYWGEELGVLDIVGNTGTSGIEGINVLYDIYRNEQLVFDPYALITASSQLQNLLSTDLFGGSSAFSGGDFVSSLIGLSETPSVAASQKSPTLASLAFTVELYWAGEVYRGYFNSFNVTEDVNNMGIFSYDIKFTFTQRRGYRTNFFAWHKTPVYGPSNSDAAYGPPHSYKTLIG